MTERSTTRRGEGGRRAAPRRRPPLSRERVLEAAVALVDEDGLAGLSMRRLADRLGVEAMSLYNHVENKDDILNGIVEAVVGEVDLAAAERDWKRGMRRRVLSAHRALTRHPWASGLWMSTKGDGPARMRYAEAVLAGLRRAGFTPAVIDHAFHVLQGHLLGYTLQEATLGVDGADLARLATEFLKTFPADEFPEMARHIRGHIRPSRSRTDPFEFGLDLILDGLERL